MSKGRFLGLSVLALGAAAGLWLAGLSMFVEQIRSFGDAAPGATQPVDAIVVLTGGSERVSVGVDLLEAGRGTRLFISGVYPGLSLEKLLGPAAARLRQTDRIALGHAAESTFGNAGETRDWMAHERLRSLRLVTANYHMPRSLMIFRAAMPDILIVPHPIMPDHVVLEGWWMHPGTASLLVTEYNKYLWAGLRLRFGPP